MLDCLDVILTAVGGLVLRVGQPARCSKCSSEIFFLRHVNGKAAPYDRNGVSHFSTCPHAEEFRR
jgi:hypothetical protein